MPVTGRGRMLMQVARKTGRSVPALIAEMLRLRLGPGRLGPSEYFDFRLYDSDLTLDQKKAFCGWRGQKVLEQILCDDYSQFLSLDKISMYTLLAGYGLPVPSLRAIYRSARPSNGVIQLQSVSELADYLRRSAPVYLKPSFGAYGRGNALVTSVDGDYVRLGDASVLPLQSFCESLKDRGGLGWILQEPLHAHPLIADCCGPKVSGVRVHTFLSKSGPTIVRAIWKINVGKEDSDNFRHGASGNMLAAVDIDSGVIRRVISGVGLEQQEVDVHPVSRKPLTGFTLPFWSEIRHTVLEAQLAFPGFLCPGWDIAISEDGPRILEVNAFGDLDLSQHAYRQGFLDERTRQLLREHEVEHLVRAPERATSRCASNGRLGARKAHWNW